MKVGQIIAVHNGGILNDTYEAEILRGGFSSGSGANGQAFWFTIEDPAMAEKASQYMTNQTEVVLNYRSQGVYSGCSSSSGGDFAVSISPAKP